MPINIKNRRKKLSHILRIPFVTFNGDNKFKDQEHHHNNCISISRICTCLGTVVSGVTGGKNFRKFVKMLRNKWDCSELELSPGPKSYQRERSNLSSYEEHFVQFLLKSLSKGPRGRRNSTCAWT